MTHAINNTQITHNQSIIQDPPPPKFKKTNPLELFYLQISLMEKDIKDGELPALFKHDLLLLKYMVKSLQEGLLPRQTV